jgi:hypothetical protein
VAGRPVFISEGYGRHRELSFHLNGPVLSHDSQVAEKMGRFDRERNPERVVHAKGYRAYRLWQDEPAMRLSNDAKWNEIKRRMLRCFYKLYLVIGTTVEKDEEWQPGIGGSQIASRPFLNNVFLLPGELNIPEYSDF